MRVVGRYESILMTRFLNQTQGNPPYIYERCVGDTLYKTTALEKKLKFYLFGLHSIEGYDRRRMHSLDALLYP